MLIPIRFAHAQRVASCFERWRVAVFARGVIDEQEDIDDRLGAEPRRRGGADMFNAHRLSREGARDLGAFLRVKRGPVWIIIAEDDCVFWRFRRADGDGFEIIVIRHKSTSFHKSALIIAENAQSW